MTTVKLLLVNHEVGLSCCTSLIKLVARNCIPVSRVTVRRSQSKIQIVGMKASLSQLAESLAGDQCSSHRNKNVCDEKYFRYCLVIFLVWLQIARCEQQTAYGNSQIKHNTLFVRAVLARYVTLQLHKVMRKDDVKLFFSLMKMNRKWIYYASACNSLCIYDILITCSPRLVFSYRRSRRWRWYKLIKKKYYSLKLFSRSAEHEAKSVYVMNGVRWRLIPIMIFFSLLTMIWF